MAALSNETQTWLREASRGELMDQLYSLGYRERTNNDGSHTYVDEMSADELFDRLSEYYALHPNETPSVSWS